MAFTGLVLPFKDKIIPEKDPWWWLQVDGMDLALVRDQGED